MLKSVKLTLILLSILALASITGTVMPQQEGGGIYHSLWFRFLIFALSANLIVCSIDRFPSTLKLFRVTPKPDRARVFEENSSRTVLLSGMGVEQASSGIQEYLRGRFRNLVIKDNGNAAFLYCEKGRISLFSVYLVHLSVLFILFGAILGSIFGFNGYVNIPEGGSIDSITLSSGEASTQKPLGFSVHCEKFLVDYYESGVPREYRSTLNFIVNGKEALNGNLLVNHPITFMGVTFYQSSYGTMPGEKAGIKIINEEKGSETNIIHADLGKAITLPDGKSILTLSGVKDNFMNLGPAALIVIKSPEGKESSIWLFKERDAIMKSYSDMFGMSPKFNPSAYKPYAFYLDDLGSTPYTGLQVSKDPGVQFVFTGFIMIAVGLVFTFFASYRKFWIKVSGENGDTRISLAGTANKNPVGMERELDRLLLKLKNAAGGGRHNG